MPADIIDDANEKAALFLAAALSNRQRSANVMPAEGVGMCLYCSADLPDERRWCNSECRDLWERDSRLRERP